MKEKNAGVNKEEVEQRKFPQIKFGIYAQLNNWRQFHGKQQPSGHPITYSKKFGLKVKYSSTFCFNSQKIIHFEKKVS